MFHKLTLRLRLSLLLGAVLACGLAIGVGLLILHAGARIRAEADGATQLAQDFVTSALARMETAADPDGELAKLLIEAQSLRHVRIFLEGQKATSGEAERTRRAPEWFAALARPREAVSRIDLKGRGGLHGALMIASNPADEIAEIWEEVIWLAMGGAGVALAAFALVFVAVSRTLAPVSALAGGLARLEQGDFAVRVAPGGSPEFITIAERINALAATLERLDEENRSLVTRMIHVQDAERRDIARDLHDEIGPFLFSIRAGVGALARKASAAAGGEAALAEGCRKIDDQLAALQQVNRRILGRLRPVALEEMGLAGALEALAQGWRESHPEVTISLDLHDANDGMDETIALTAYRIVQEGLTNVFRHSGASCIDIVVSRDEFAQQPALSVVVRDNGAGIDTGKKEGIGLRGMSERVAALGGRLRLTSGEPSGVVLAALLPLQ
jgi:two-component system, NarL family, sensor histidine kinase UhpB